MTAGRCYSCDQPRQLLPVEGKRLCGDCAWAAFLVDARSGYFDNIGVPDTNFTELMGAINGRTVRVEGEDGGQYAVTALQLAVPLRIAELAAMTPAARARTTEEWRGPDSQTLAERADMVLYADHTVGPKRRKSTGNSARAFNALARTAAVLAFAPGGVDFMDMHWCAVPHADCPKGRRSGQRVGADVLRGIRALARQGMTDQQISEYLDGVLSREAVLSLRQTYRIPSRCKADPYAEWAADREAAS